MSTLFDSVTKRSPINDLSIINHCIRIELNTNKNQFKLEFNSIGRWTITLKKKSSNTTTPINPWARIELTTWIFNLCSNSVQTKGNSNSIWIQNDQFKLKRSVDWWIVMTMKKTISHERQKIIKKEASSRTPARVDLQFKFSSFEPNINSSPRRLRYLKDP